MNQQRFLPEVKAFATATLVATSVLGAFGTDTASAANYDVWTCQTPDGSSAPTHDGESGWRPASSGTNIAGGNLVEDQCSSGGGLIAQHGVGDSQPTPSSVGWIFSAPPSTVVDRYSIEFEGYARPRTSESPIYGEVALHSSSQLDPTYDERFYGTGLIPRHSDSHSGLSARTIHLRAGCGDVAVAGRPCGTGADGGPARFKVYRGTFTLADRDAPAVISVSGDATTDAIWAGSTGISVGATDQGGGVYRLGVEVDGQVKAWKNLAGAPCVAYPGTERTFLAPKPCPSTVGGIQTLSTADLPEGSHTVRIVVEDAAGNQTTAYGPVSKTLSRTAIAPNEPGPLNGSPAAADARMTASWEGTESARKSIRFNQQPVIRGQLTTAQGQPIKDAAVRVTITRDSRNSPAFERESLSTNSEGRFRWKMPKGSSSRKITLSYRQRVRDPKPVFSKDLRLTVKAGVKLTLSRSVARRGQSVKLTGTVVGRPVPGGGKLVELQARNRGGRWITFRTVRARKSGAFAATYRFRNGGPARFQMRARARKSGDYPYATGSSPVRNIRIR